LQGEYGEKGIASFIQLATKSGICIARSMKISRNAPLQEFDAVVDSLLEDTRAKVSKDNMSRAKATRGKVSMGSHRKGVLVIRAKVDSVKIMRIKMSRVNVIRVKVSWV
jgi:hypothetical protein